MIFVVPARLADGRWSVELPEFVEGSEELDRVASLEGYETSVETVEVDGELEQLRVHRRGALAWVRLDELPDFDPDSVPGVD